MAAMMGASGNDEAAPQQQPPPRRKKSLGIGDLIQGATGIPVRED